MKSLKATHCGVIELYRLVDGRDGVLSVAEVSKNIPFDIKRVYYIYDLKHKSALRGKHAHRHNQQVIFCINGSFTLTVDDGRMQDEIVLDKPNIGVFMDIGLWHTMKDFSDDCILLVLASDLYDESDYIRSYEEFKQYVTR
ncbi:MAG: FdtA/QdtA family cupin domain-containing protein [Prevotellaceae bacterium]|jgi:dTDP-4-dehydrorhamnose 3,5-epimerase-like enzyme|nr:FdtA/QdtA family cupin domain-containing protein [Prevotellaceae bacterium]